MVVKKALIPLVVALVAVAWVVQQILHPGEIGFSKQTLRVLTYSSFAGAWGPGPSLKAEFEKICDCHVEFAVATDAGLILQQLAAPGEPVDFAIGFDQLDLPRATKDLRWRPLKKPEGPFNAAVEAVLGNTYFLPYDYGPLAFVGRKSDLKNLPERFSDLLRPEFAKQIALEDPRTSSPGLQFLFWIYKIKGREGFRDFFKSFASQIQSVSPSWSTAYGLFQNKQARLALSYMTSPLYHLIEEKNDDFVALSFADGHPVQFEFMGIPEQCRQCALAQKFVDFILTSPSQKVIMNKNYMMPVVLGVENGTPFEAVQKIKLLEPLSLEDLELRDSLINDWTEIRRDSN